MPGVHGNIGVYGWLKPTLTVELVAGGSLLQNTKYYVCGLTGFTPYTYLTGGGPISDVHEITTTTTDLSIKITHKTYRNITAFADNGDSRTLITSTRHCVTDNVQSTVADSIKIASGSYTGTWIVDEWVDYNQFIIDTPYVDNVPVQFYTDSHFYNKPLHGGVAASGIAYFVDTAHPLDGNGFWKPTNYKWTRRPWTTPLGTANPLTITSQPTENFTRYAYHPELARMTTGYQKILEDYGSVTVDIDGSGNLQAVYDEVQVSGFVYNCGYANGGYTIEPYFNLAGDLRTHLDANLYHKGGTIEIWGEIRDMGYNYDKLKLEGCCIVVPNGIFSQLMAFNGEGSVFYNNANTNTFLGWITGDNLTLYCAPRFSQARTDVPNQQYIDEVTGLPFTYGIVQNKIFRSNGAGLIQQISYNTIKFENTEITPLYWVMSGAYNPPIYMMENCIIRYSYTYTYNFRMYNYDLTAQSVLKFLNIDAPDDADNHKKITKLSKQNTDMLFYRRIEIYVQDSSGVVVVGVTVKIVDGQLNEYEDVTDVDGYVFFDVLEQKSVIVNADLAIDPTDDTFYTDFVITTSYPGYAAHRLELADMFGNEQLEIGLVPQIQYVEGLINADVEEDEITGVSEAEAITGVSEAEVIEVDVEEDTIYADVEEETITGTIE